ncbi:MAG: formate dehydrogenase accessory sulfurtransferase FdhD [Vulcanimicrobiaceae bacterium]
MSVASPEERPGRTSSRAILSYDGTGEHRRIDDLVTEEPLELRLRAGSQQATLAVTMRTPGNDFELAAGFAYNESLVTSRDEIVGLSYCLDKDLTTEQRYNIVYIDVRASALPDIERFERHFTMTSACGICGRAVLDRLETLGVKPLAEEHLRVDIATILGLPSVARASQSIFDRTGGLHAAALFTTDGTLLATREDVGRHNALDKLIGWACIEKRLPLSNTILLVSGRTSYELVQKAAVARIPILASVSAPSSLAVDLAKAFGITLLGFVRDGRANCYAGEQRIIS